MNRYTAQPSDTVSINCTVWSKYLLNNVTLTIALL